MAPNNLDTTTICGVTFTNITLSQFEKHIKTDSGDTQFIVTPNVDFVVRADQDSHFKDVLNKADLSVCDSAIVYHTSKMVGKPLKSIITGFDAMSALLRDANSRKSGIFLLGSTAENIQSAADNITLAYPNVTLAGVMDGFFNVETETSERVKAINDSGAEYLFIGMGSPRQESWAYQNKDQLNVKFVICVGGLFDIYSGKTKRAPALFQQVGMEWFWRMACEPRRLWKRYLVEDTRYFKLLIKDRLFSGK